MRIKGLYYSQNIFSVKNFEILQYLTKKCVLKFLKGYNYKRSSVVRTHDFKFVVKRARWAWSFSDCFALL